jgi:type IV secretion system protein VirD4
MAFHHPMRDAEDHADVSREVVFAPKELRLANELSERLGYTTVRSPSRSRPTGLSRGHRSVSESDQRRALLLPQELMQFPADDLIVLKAGMPAVRGRKIAYYRERAFLDRVRPAPQIPVAPRSDVETPPAGPAVSPPSVTPDPLTLEGIAPVLAVEGLEPLPPAGASPDVIEAWVERFIDASARMNGEETDHGR